MRALEIAVAAGLIAIVGGGTAYVATHPESAARRPVVETVRPCRTATEIAYRTGSTAALDAYVENMRENERRDRAELDACRAYLLGAADREAGRIVAIDVR